MDPADNTDADPQAIPALPDDLTRVPTEYSVIEPDSIQAENGRTYHKDLKYLLPNDGAEQDRLDFQHHGFKLLTDGVLALAPMAQTPEYVLDIATGTGIWAIEFAQENPGSKVIGTDLSAIQPTIAVSNCSFVKEDSEDEWVLDHPLDYVHLRFVLACFKDHRTVMKHALRHLKPGGWIEYQDVIPVFESTVEGNLDGTALKRWTDLVVQGNIKLGRDFYVAKQYKTWLTETGFVDVKEMQLEWPCSPWSDEPALKEVGWYQLRNILDGIRGVSWLMLESAGLSAPEIESLIVEVREELQCKKYICYWPTFIVCGRKPLDGESSE